MSTKEDYKGFFDDAPVALARTDVKTGEFLMANRFAANLLGYETIDELKKNCRAADLYPHETRQQLIRDLKKFGTVERRELELRLSDGKTAWIRGSFRLTPDNQCIECFLSDITEVIHLRETHLVSLQSMSQKLDCALVKDNSIKA